MNVGRKWVNRSEARQETNESTNQRKNQIDGVSVRKVQKCCCYFCCFVFNANQKHKCHILPNRLIATEKRRKEEKRKKITQDSTRQIKTAQNNTKLNVRYVLLMVCRKVNAQIDLIYTADSLVWH